MSGIGPKVKCRRLTDVPATIPKCCRRREGMQNAELIQFAPLEENSSILRVCAYLKLACAAGEEYIASIANRP